jgi:Short C-terminal domain
MGMRRRQRRRRMVAVGAIAHHEGVKRGEAEAGYADQGAADQAYAEPAYAQPAPTDYAPPPIDPAGELDHLAQLHASGVLSDDEFAAAKAKVLGS